MATDATEPVEIPEDMLPHPDQVPSWATDVPRFNLCFAIGRSICGRDDPVFIRELYEGDLPT